MLRINLPADIEDRLDALAEVTGKNTEFYVIEAIRDYMDDLKDLQLAEKRLEDIRAGRGKTIPLKQVVLNLGLKD